MSIKPINQLQYIVKNDYIKKTTVQLKQIESGNFPHQVPMTVLYLIFTKCSYSCAKRDTKSIPHYSDKIIFVEYYEEKRLTSIEGKLPWAYLTVLRRLFASSFSCDYN